MAVVLLQHACPSPLQRRSSLPSGHRAYHGALPRLDTNQHGLASVQTQAAAASALLVHALDGVAAVHALALSGVRPNLRFGWSRICAMDKLMRKTPGIVK